MTNYEIIQYLKAIQQKQKEQREAIYLEAQLTANFVGYVLNGKQIPPIQNVFPETFKAAAEQDKKKREELQLALYKEQMIDWAKAHNKQRAKTKKDGENN